MSKIIQAVNAMLEKKGQISNAIKGGKECFFLFNNKYKWSMAYNVEDDIYWLYFYAGRYSLEQLAALTEGGQPLESTEYFAYSTKDLSTKEAYQTFRDLYTTVKEKILGIDKVLEDIIGKDEADIPF